MAKQKRLNKNLIAFLTVMGMVLLVSVFTLIVWQQTRRDPEIIAQSARESEKAGDLEEAARRYVRAWEASEVRGQPNSQYVIAAARCMFEMGELASWRGLLEKAASKLPNDQPLQRALLEGLWRIRDIIDLVILEDIWRDTGRRLVELDPDDLLGLVSQAQALWVLGGEANEAAADELAQKAYRLEPTDPHVAITYLSYLERAFIKTRREAVAAGARPADLTRLTRDYIEKVLPVLDQAAAAHPEDVPVATAHARMLQSRAGLMDEAGERAAADETLSQAGQALERTAAATTGRPSPELFLALARQRYFVFDRAHPEPTAAQLAELRAELEAIDDAARRAIELDKAMYEAYQLRAELALRYAIGPQGQELSDDERLERGLAILDAARDSTLTLRSIRAVLRAEDRLLMLRRAFDIGLGYVTTATDENTRAARLARATAYLDDATVKYPEHPVTYHMQAKNLIARQDVVGAVAALEEASKRAGQLRYAEVRGRARYWLEYVRVPQLPEEQLALLYAQREQWGQAEQYTAQAIKLYEDAEMNPPSSLVALAAELLARIGKAQDAFDLLGQYRLLYAQDQTLTGTLVSVLTQLGRVDEAREVMGKMSGKGARFDLWRSRMLVEMKDYAAAEQVLRGVLDSSEITDDEYRDGFLRLMDAMARAERRAEALALCRQWLANPPRPALARMIQAATVDLEAAVTEALTPEQRAQVDAQREEVIRQNPDPFLRAKEFYGYYRRRAAEAERRGANDEAAAEFAQALSQLEQMRKLKPDDMAGVEEEFNVRLMRREFDRARELTAALSRHEKGLGWDRAGGATYRGDLALAEGNAELAIREFQQAIRSLPKSADLQTRLGRACLAGNRLVEGIDALRQAVEINPRGVEAYFYLRQAYRQRAGQAYGAERDKLVTLAQECEAKVAELAPDHPLVKAWKQETDEEQSPQAAIARRLQERAEKPDDAANLVRLAELFVNAWEKSASDPAARSALLSQANAYFQDVLTTAPQELRFSLARYAADFYSRSQQAEAGEPLLRGLVEQTTGEMKVGNQLLLAAFFEALGNLEAAEREYQQAQRLVPSAVADAEARRRWDLQVGISLIGFYERQRRSDKVIEACRWALDRVRGLEASQAAAIQMVRLTLAHSLLTAGRLADADAELRDYLGQYPREPQGLMARAQVRFVSGQRELALDDLNQILSDDPDHVLALVTRGRLSLELARYDRAREDLTRAEEKIGRDPRLEPDLRRLLASLYGRTHKYDLAEAQLRLLLEALDARGAPSDQKQQVVRQLARLLYGAQNQFDRARRLISEYMEKHPEDMLWPFELGRLFEAQGTAFEAEARQAKDRGDVTRERERIDAARQSYATAATYYQRAGERAEATNPLYAVGSAIARLGALRQAGRDREVLEIYSQYPFDRLPVQIRDEVRARMGIQAAKSLHGLGQHDAAEKQWEQCLSDGAAASVAMAGEVTTALRQTAQARTLDSEALLRRAIERVAPESLPGRRLRSVLAAQLATGANPAAALPLLSELIAQLQPGSAEHLTTLLTRAQALEVTGDREGSIRSYREILEAYRDNVTALNNLAYLLAESPPPLFAPAEARGYAERLRSLVPGNENAATLLDTVGWVYFKCGEAELAVAALEEAHSLDAENSSIALHLAEVYQQVGRAADARALLTRGLEGARGRGEADTIQRFEDALNKLTR